MIGCARACLSFVAALVFSASGARGRRSHHSCYSMLGMAWLNHGDCESAGMSVETMGGGLATAVGTRGGAGSFWGRRGMLGEAVVEVAKRLLQVQFRREGPCQGSLCSVSEAREGRVCAACAHCTLCAGGRVLARRCPFSVRLWMWCWSWGAGDLSVAQQLERRA